MPSTVLAGVHTAHPRPAHPRAHSRPGLFRAALLPTIVLAIVLPGTLSLVACGPGAQTVAPPVAPPPPTRTDDVVDVLHGIEVPDPYRWLEDQEAPETRAWIDAQNAYTDSVLADLPGRDALSRRFTELLKTDTVSFPTVRGNRYFYSKRKADQDLRVIYLRDGEDGEEQVLIDPHPWSEDHSVSAGVLDISRDGTLLAYSVREGGEDEMTIKLFDVDARADLPDALPKSLYFSLAITPDNRGFYYVHQGEDGPRIYYHALGADRATDVKLFGDGYGREKILIASLAEDGRYLTVNVFYGSSADQSEVYLADLGASDPASGISFQPVVTDVPARFVGETAGGRLYIQSNWEAPNNRIFAVDPAHLAREAWTEIVPTREDAVIEGFSPAAGRLFVNYLQDVKSRVVAFQPDGTEIGEIAFDTLGSVSGVGGPWEGDQAFFAFSSFAVPTTIYRYHPASGEREVWDRSEVPIDPERFEVSQVWFHSKDGTRVPMFLVHGKGLKLDGTHPTLLTGYGGFNVALSPFFSAAAAVWVEQGGVYAVANLRGGGEFGEEWHKAGMQAHKQNVFDDFIAAAEWLIAEGYTRPEKLAVSGGSNGGLLVGALLTQRPDLVRAVICSYPLLDMVRYHQFLVAGYWVPEYGSSEAPDLFPVLLAYSPYHNVRPGVDYPAVLFITGDGDTRVAPLHARKMAARVQAVNPVDSEPVLLRYHIKAGHSGGEPISEQIDNLTESYSFLLWQLGESGK